MADHVATIAWRCDGGDFARGRYSRVHDWSFDGGAGIRASSSPHVVPLPFSDPAAVDPEEALVAATSSCHMLFFLHVARDAGFAVTGYRDVARGTMGEVEPGRMAVTRIVLKPEIEWADEAPDADTLARMHHQAHEMCFIANSLRTEIVVE